MDPGAIMPREDELAVIQRLLLDERTSAVVLVGGSGMGKSTLAALLYRRLLAAKESGAPGPRYLVWLSLRPYTTVSDVLFAILSAVNVEVPAFFFLGLEQQVDRLLQALQRPQESALIMLDQFELLLQAESMSSPLTRAALSRFLDILQANLGGSRIVLTSQSAPAEQELGQARLRVYPVPRIGTAEGIALIQRRGVQAAPGDLLLAWERSAGHVFALTLLSSLVNLSGIALATLLHAPDYSMLWKGDIAFNLLAFIYSGLSPVHCSLLRVLSLFEQPVSAQAILMIMGDSGAFDVRELETLQRLSLVQTGPGEGGMLDYSLHPLVRLCVLEHYLQGGGIRPGDPSTMEGPAGAGLDARQGALAMGHMQVAAYYWNVVRSSQQSPEQRTSLRDMEPLVAVMRHLSHGRHWQDACDFLFSEDMHESMVRLGAWNTLVDIYTLLLPPLGMVSRRDEGLIDCHLGMLYGRIGDLQRSQTCYEMALAIQGEIGDLRSEAMTLANQGELLRIHGALEQARVNFERALMLNMTQQDVYLQCIVLHELGLLYHGLREYSTARGYYSAALQLAHNLNSSEPAKIAPKLGIILTNLGMLLYEKKERLEALALLLSALNIRKSLNDPSVVTLERFLAAIEQKLGPEEYAQQRKRAKAMLAEVLARFLPQDMRQ
jgi:tetratricopeptide (TPR) repeat protein